MRGSRYRSFGRNISNLADRALDDAMTLLGLDTEEKECLAHLVRGGESTAGDLARLTGVPRANTYKLLRSLVAEGLVNERPGHPLTFTALDIPAALRLNAAMASERATSMLQLAERLPPEMGTPKQMRAMPEDVGVLAGRQAIFRELQRLIHAAKEKIVISGNDMFARRLSASSDLMLSIEQAMQRSVKVTILVPPGRASQAIHSRLKIVSTYAELPRVFVQCVTDASLFIILPQPDDEHPLRGEDLGIKVNSATLADGITERLQQLASGTDSD